MRQSNKAVAIATLMVIAASSAIADDTRSPYSGAGAGYMPAGELNLQPALGAGESRAAFGGFRLNSQLVLEGFYADINPTALPPEHNGNLYTRSLPSTSLAENATSTVAGVSLVATLPDRGPIRPFARAGLHHYDLEGAIGQPLRGNSLLFGAGANMDLARGWNARLEWQRYRDVDRQDLNLFSASFEYRF